MPDYYNERPMINGVPALIDSFRMRVKMGQNGMAGSKRAIASGDENGIPYYEYEDLLARPEKVRRRILNPYLDEAYMSAHVYLHSDLFQEDMKDTLLVPEFEFMEGANNDFPACEKRLLDLTIECRNRNLENDDWRELVDYVTSASIAPSQYVINQYVAMRGYIIDGVLFERAALRWEALMMADSTRENWPKLVGGYPTFPIQPARSDLDPLVFLGDAYVILTMASHHFREFFLAEKEHLGF